MWAVRFGSYSMCATVALTPSLSLRRKSMTRYWRLWPPPLWRVVIRPWPLRPPGLLSGRTSDFWGFERVLSVKSATLEPRRPGVVGLCLRIAMRFSRPYLVPPSGGQTRDLDGLAVGREGHDGALGVLTLPVS